MSFGYFPEFKNKNILKDLILKIIGYPYAPRRNEARLVINQAKLKKTDYILDIGCGDGIFTNDISKRGYNVIGLDNLKGATDIAKKRAKSMGIDTDYIVGDAQKLPFEENIFDKIISISTFEHIENDMKVFKECYRILKPGGTLTVSIPMPKVLGAIKLAIKLPQDIKNILFNTMVAKVNSTKEYEKERDKKYSHYRNYTEDMMEERELKSDLKITKINYHIKLFSIIPHSLIHTLKIFEWEKDKKNKYKFSSQIAMLLTFPFFYPLYLLDNLIKVPGHTIVVTFQKL